MRPLDHLREAGNEFPDLWKCVRDLRAMRAAAKNPSWPEWCYVPVGRVLEFLLNRRQDLAIRQGKAANLTALAAWRMTKGVYRLDRELFDALWDTPVVLLGLPEWRRYIETPDRTLLGRQRMHGFFVHLEYDAVQSGRMELRFILDLDPDGNYPVLAPCLLHIGAKTLDQALDETVAQTVATARKLGLNPTQVEELKTAQRSSRELLQSLVSLTLYLCSAAREIRDSAGETRQPGNPQPRRMGREIKLIAAEKPTVWECGWTIGETLRTANRAARAEDKTARTVRPHVRRAHWHHYWVGPHESRTSVLKWIHPVIVGGGEIPVTVRNVKEKKND